VLAPNGYLHAASVVGLADTACGLATRALLPEGASGFTTIELKANYLGTARDGRISTEATNVHAGRTTQVWDAVVRTEAKTIALFRCTQSVLWPR
jgi:1,4-dihydroxy-2-naphthoyl-CoA hydrolase